MTKLKLTRNFTWQELACKDGSPVPPEFRANAKAIASRVQALRDLIGCPIEVHSGYRTFAWNLHVKGEDNSQHLTASAMDISAVGWTPAQLADLWEGLVRLQFFPDGGLGRYATFIHVDCRGHKARWTG